MYVKGSSFGAWYDVLSSDTQRLTAEWARRSGVTGTDAEVMAKIARTPAQGGGFVAGGIRMCLSNRVGGQTEPLRAESVPCPAGSGGIAGEQVKEISAADVTRIVQENIRREREEGAYSTPRNVEVYGTIVSGDGNPIPGAVFTIAGVSGTTGPTGEFFDVVVPPGTYMATITAPPGYLSRELTLVRVPVGTSLDLGRIILISDVGVGDPMRDGIVEETEETAKDTVKEDTGDTTETVWYKNKWTYIVGIPVVVGVAWLGSRLGKRG
jgi:hypothetical protein